LALGDIFARRHAIITAARFRQGTFLLVGPGTKSSEIPFYFNDLDHVFSAEESASAADEKLVQLDPDGVMHA
jgi:hypothetical protein